MIQNERGRRLAYTIEELCAILRDLHGSFGEGFFPLANNVEKLGEGSERAGLGTTILKHRPRDISHAQGASYLGVVMEECGYFEWNGKHLGIAWRLRRLDLDQDALAARLVRPAGRGRP